MMVEELEVIADNDKIIEVTDALPKVPEMLSADSDDEATKAEAPKIDVVATDDDESKAVLEIEVADNDSGEAPKAENKAEVADDETLKVEPKADIECVDDEALTEDDIAREAVLNEINEIADSADRSLNVKVPFIDTRATKNGVIGKFLSMNKHLLNQKYHSLVDSDVKISGELYNSMLDDVKSNVKSLTKAQADKAKSVMVGFVDTGKGYFADASFQEVYNGFK